LNAAGDGPPPGHYRVIHQWADLVAAGAESSEDLRSADKDVNKCAAKRRERLVAKGPGRLIVRPENWRESMDQLEASLPHFREPVRLLGNSLALADATNRPVRVPPMLLLGPPGVSKTYRDLRGNHSTCRVIRPCCCPSVRPRTDGAPA